MSLQRSSFVSVTNKPKSHQPNINSKYTNQARSRCYAIPQYNHSSNAVHALVMFTSIQIPTNLQTLISSYLHKLLEIKFVQFYLANFVLKLYNIQISSHLRYSEKALHIYNSRNP